MKLHKLNIAVKFFRKEETTATKQRRLLRSALKVRSFSMMKIQEKIILVARLIDLFQKDYGFVPEELERVLVGLNRDLDKVISKSFETSQKLSRIDA